MQLYIKFITKETSVVIIKYCILKETRNEIFIISMLLGAQLYFGPFPIDGVRVSSGKNN